MRANEFITEAPLTDYVPLGFDTKGTRSKDVDKKLIQHPVNYTKAVKFFENTPYNFRLFFNNNPKLRGYRESGPQDPETIKKMFGKDAEQILKNSENSITIVFIGNYGDQAVMMTPWIMAHRFGHAIQAGNRRLSTYGTTKNTDPWSKAESYFFRYVNNMLSEYYRKKSSGDYQRTEVNWSMAAEYNALFNAMGTQRSSRENQIKRPYEFFYELFAQFLKDGTITLNPVPASLSYGRKAWGRPTQYMGIVDMYRDEISRQQISDEVAANLTNLFNHVLRQTVGKVYVM